jgi:hypothetical protein
VNVGLHDQTTVSFCFHSLFSLLLLLSIFLHGIRASLRSLPCSLLLCFFVVSWLFPKVSGCFGISVSRDASSEIFVQIGPQIGIFRHSSKEEDSCLVAGIGYSNSTIRISLFWNSAILSCIPNTYGSLVSDSFSVYL